MKAGKATVTATKKYATDLEAINMIPVDQRHRILPDGGLQRNSTAQLSH